MTQRYIVRPMLMGDIPQVAEIEKEAFPEQWPPTAYRRELENRVACYFVAEVPEGKAVNQKQGVSAQPGLVSRIKYLIFGQPSQEEDAATTQLIVGAVGLWLMFDEAHITTIAVRQSYWRQGIGEFLLQRAIDKALEVGAVRATLEVRASNAAAQSLYEKYGFQRMGIRKNYYTETREDAIIMTTDHITSKSYQAFLQCLKQAHRQRWQDAFGPADSQISRD